MIHQLAKKIAFLFSERKIILKEKEAIYAYGMELLIATVVNSAVIIATALAYSVFIQTIFMMIPFIIIRSKAGGFHAKTHLGCIIGFNVTYQFTLFIIRQLPSAHTQLVSTILLMISIAVLLIIGCIPNENRKITETQFMRFKKKSRFLAIILSVIGVILARLIPFYGLFYASGLIMAAGSMIAEIIKIKGVKRMHALSKINTKALLLRTRAFAFCERNLLCWVQSIALAACAALALILATIGANQLCMFWYHQPEMPDEVRNLHEF